ncbi:YlxM family DNA-binding protein [Lachnoclostridium sp. MSJ-17]|uniref:YlxM family DNA-binding protein n=1 Tax=Lachnoclostridium sp. MSJ-17 TaxID=2841516 RepID=UPI001C10C98D|nr:DNA-binding protein [Lachnoclostridium sp. MSJ-17]MBU5462187.1 DNA-binding protein [Lachnoclostridium sp. MSJ-17]
MEKNIEVSLLLDFYGELLKPSCKQMAELYYNDDLSLAEVAAETGITRQGVRDKIKRGEKQLFEFEQKLGLLSRFQQLEAGLDDISVKARKISESTDDNDIRSLAEDILRQTGELKEKE